jgi:hypothetical protein
MENMKKFLMIILSGTLLFAPGKIWGADWKYYGENQNASYFFDVASITLYKNVIQQTIVKVWVKAVYSEKGRLDEKRKLGGNLSNITDSIAREEIDCKNKRQQVLALTVYSMEGEVVISGSRQRERLFAIPESILESFCKDVTR